MKTARRARATPAATLVLVAVALMGLLAQAHAVPYLAVSGGTTVGRPSVWSTYDNVAPATRWLHQGWYDFATDLHFTIDNRWWPVPWQRQASGYMADVRILNPWWGGDLTGMATSWAPPYVSTDVYGYFPFSTCVGLSARFWGICPNAVSFGNIYWTKSGSPDWWDLAPDFWWGIDAPRWDPIGNHWVHRFTIHNDSLDTAFWATNTRFAYTDAYYDDLDLVSYSPSGEAAVRLAPGMSWSYDVDGDNGDLTRYVYQAFDLAEDVNGTMGDVLAGAKGGHQTPEPGTLGVVGVGLGLLLLRRRKRT